MIPVQTATEIVLDHSLQLGTESISLDKANGRVLREELSADRAFPPFDRVTMDGIAIVYKQFAQGQRAFLIKGVQAAGSPPLSLENPNHCLEVMTGAILPKGVDTVIRYEDVEIVDDVATIQVEELKEGKNVHLQGLDRAQGSILLSPNRIISPAEIGVAATVGKSHLQVARLPKTVIIASGDELVPIEDNPLAYQIRTSNSHQIRAVLQQYGLDATLMHIIDEPDAIKQQLTKALADYEVIILSGGVSKGKFDFIPKVLDELGVEKLFHKVEQRPGKPFWFGQSVNGQVVFALPGNPVSSFMCTYRYILPWLHQSLGLDPLPSTYAVLEDQFRFKANLTYFLQVKISYSAMGQIIASPVAGKGSGDLANLVDADGFLELPNGRDWYGSGEAFRFWAYR